MAQSQDTSKKPIKPTLLAFHGSGSNAVVHSVQLARLSRLLNPHFTIDNLEAPYPCPPGPGILPFFDGCGPFKRWLDPSVKITLEQMRSGNSPALLSPEVEAQIRNAVKSARAKGSEVVGLIGFSQGTRLVAGLLRGREIVRTLEAEGNLDLNDERSREQVEWLTPWKFALSVCGSYPPPLIPNCIAPILASSGLPPAEQEALKKKKIQTPTFHVQGLQDDWLWAGNNLIANEFEVGEGKSVVLEAEMGHHYPTLPEESERIAKWVMDVLREK